jgi:hypothetical protein
MSSTQNLSLYIPSVYANITTENIKDTICRMMLGSVDRVEIIEKPGKPNSAIVYFDRWFDTDISRKVRQEISVSGGSSKLFYAKKNKHVYWTLVLNKEPTETLVMSTPNVTVTNNVQIAPKKNKNKPHRELVRIPFPNLDLGEGVDIYVNNDEEIDVDEEFEKFMTTEPDYSLVSSDYAQSLEFEIQRLREENNHLHMGWVNTFTAYQQSLYMIDTLQDKSDKWFEFIENKQFDRLYNTVMQHRYAENFIHSNEQNNCTDNNCNSTDFVDNSCLETSNKISKVIPL